MNYLKMVVPCEGVVRVLKVCTLTPSHESIVGRLQDDATFYAYEFLERFASEFALLLNEVHFLGAVTNIEFVLL